MKMLRVGKIIYDFNSWYHSRFVLIEFSNFLKFHRFLNYISDEKQHYHALFAVSIRYWRKLFQNAPSYFLKPVKRTCWMGNAVIEVNNADRKYALRYFRMSLERFEDLFNFAECPNTEFFLVRIQSKYGKIRFRNNSVFGHIFTKCWWA